MTNEEIFEKNAKEILVHYSKEDFKKSFPTLLKVFYKSMDECSDYAYAKGYKDATSEAIVEIRKNYIPNP